MDHPVVYIAKPDEFEINPPKRGSERDVEHP